MGHRIFAADVVRPGEEAGPLLICMECGAYAEAGGSAALRGQCRATPSKHAADAISRVRRGLLPKPGKAAKGEVVQHLCSLADFAVGD